MTFPCRGAALGREASNDRDIRDTIEHWLVDKYKIVDESEFIQ
jgi:hypothetical protein